MSQQTPPRNDDQNILAITVLFGIVIALMFVVFLNQPVKQAPPPTEVAQVATEAPAEATTVAVEPTAEATAQAEGSQPASYTTEQVTAGQRVFGGLCFACHGQGGIGIPGLGKPLVGTEFVHSLTDDELVAFITVGRQPTDPLNTTGQLMPARGGNPMLSDQDLYNVVAYIRSLNGAPVGDNAAAPAEEQTSAPDAAPTEVRRPTTAENWTPPVLGGGSASAEATPAAEATAETVVVDGSGPYARYCSACHGPAGEGVGGQAALVGMASDWDAFVQEITVPAPVGSFSTGFVHPFRGGVPALTDAEIAVLVAHIKHLGG